MRMLTSLTRPTDGEAWINGNPVSDRDAIRASIGYLPEEPPVLTNSPAANSSSTLVDFVISCRRDGDPDYRLVGSVRSSDDADKRIDDYSKGMRQKVGLIQALLHDPDVVFLDEPTSGLDPRAARTVLDVIADLTDDGHTVFLLDAHPLGRRGTRGRRRRPL